MEALIAVAVVIVIIGLLIWAIGSYLSRQVDVGNDPDEPEPGINEQMSDAGSPLFRASRNVLGKNCPLDTAEIGDLAVVPCRFGVLEMKVVAEAGDGIRLEDADATYSALAKLDRHYLSKTVADKYAVPQKCYRLSSIAYKSPSGGSPPIGHWKNNIEQFVREDSIFGITGDDLLDLLIIYYFFFDGFDQPYEYYDALDPMDPGLDPEYWDGETGDFVYPEEEIVDTVEPPVEEVPPEGPPVEEPTPEAEPVPEPVVEEQPQVDNIPTYTPPEPEPEPVKPEPPQVDNIPTYEPPAPDPEPERYGGGYDSGGGSYDSGGGYDSGGDSGGNWD